MVEEYREADPEGRGEAQGRVAGASRDRSGTRLDQLDPAAVAKAGIVLDALAATIADSVANSGGRP